MTASEFIDASIPDEVAAVQEAAEASPGCSNANTDAGSDFQVEVAIDAASADAGHAAVRDRGRRLLRRTRG